MPSAKKLAAAAAHTRQQADLLAERYEKQKVKVERMRDLLDGAEDALVQAEEDMQAAESDAVEASEAAAGISVEAFPDAANVGVVR